MCTDEMPSLGWSNSGSTIADMSKRSKDRAFSSVSPSTTLDYDTFHASKMASKPVAAFAVVQTALKAGLHVLN